MAIKFAKEKKYPTDLVAEDDESDLETNTEVSTDTINYKIKAAKLIQKKEIPNCICCNKPYGNPPENDQLIRDIVMQCYKSQRVKDYQDWIRIGWALHKLWHGYLDFYKEWSSQASNYEEAGCERVWKGANDKSYGLPSLVKWAREDKPKVYNDLIEDIIKEQIKKSSLNTDDDLANIIYTQFRHNYVCVDIVKDSWYQFTDHRWIPIQAAYTLYERISTEICPMLTRIQNQFLASKSRCDDDNINTDDLKELNLGLKKTYTRLKDSGSKSAIMKACRVKFHDPKFLEKLNANPKLIGFDNGVFDLQIEQVVDGQKIIGCFRDGSPDDYITFTTKYDWEEYSDDHPQVLEILDYFSKVQVNPDVREYLLRLIATYIDGAIRNQQFIFWPGSGGNGKSSTIDLMKQTFGDYNAPMPVKVLTGATPDAGQATPALADKQGKRFVPVSEPAHNEILNISTMKLLTGGDEICARPLYGPMFYYIPQFKMILACNNLPIIPSLDGGTWRRIIVLGFDSKFVDADDYEKIKNTHHRETYFIKDPDLIGENGKISNWGAPFMWYLLRRVYQRYYADEMKKKGSGLRIPTKVKEDTEKYRKDSDKYYEYINKNATKGDPDDKLDFKTFYDGFKGWYRGCYHDKPPTIQEFTDYLNRENYKVIGNFILGYKLMPEGCAEPEEDELA